jgi:hypothetical protein
VRAWAIAASITGLGCQFKAPSPAVVDAGEDAPPASADAPPPDAAYVPACMTDPTYTASGAHRYKLLTRAVDYDTAIDACAADGAHLAVVDSDEENEHLRTLIDGDSWIGLDDLTVEGSFQWVTGAASPFRRFPLGEPNNLVGEDCAQLQDSGSWNDAGCELPRRPICECDPAYRPPPTPSCRMATTGFEVRSGRRLFVRTAARTWQDAEDDCGSIGAHLLVIGDADENGDLDGRLLGPTWLGYTDAAAEGQFKWVDGSPSTFHRWVVLVPTNDTLDCAVLQDFGTWTDVACDDMHPYACECDPLPP